MVSRNVLDFPMRSGHDADLKINVAPATTNPFSILGAHMVLGRGFLGRGMARA
jgi:hypothetical protein